ncbi:acyl-CoA dehydrogenase family protein [Tropicimonas sp. IMCC6043]|uniref:acyl-CoA dehydrogenase family protein n=1 Tax=Tropicimonas sp. IMCC6043 TaxID=2510645 RepID=UPI00101C8FF5|nr:acyl-CoA dehydrogenase family protein [Tropicimonas sp. IMCC6043]RYH12301.1 hypothetical protein EU800_01720 [Tropicimonas sp. IMCC6043]
MIRFDAPSEEALLLKDTAMRFIADNYGLEKRAAMLAKPADAVPAHWTEMAELGWLAAPLPEACGGLGLSPTDVLPLLEVLGAGLILEPVSPAILGCAATIAAALPAETAADLLEAMLAGERIEVLATGGASATAPAVTATWTSGSWTLSGKAPMVVGGAAADIVWAVARVDDALGLFRVPADAVALTGFRLFDGQTAATVDFDGVSCTEDQLFPMDDTALVRGTEMALLARLAEALGLIEALYRTTLDYVKLREQFGRPIGAFQSVQHRMADMFIHCEEVRSMVQLAAEAMDGAPADLRRQVHAATWVKLVDNGRAVLRDAVQLHGGMGMTDELIVGHMVKRLLMLIQSGGSREDWLSAAAPSLHNSREAEALHA